MTPVIAVLLYSLYVVSAVDVPKGYILDVWADCGNSTSDTPSVKILTDLDIKAVARCANGDQPLRSRDKIHYKTVSSYQATSRGCLFKNVKATHSIQVAVMYGNPGAHLLTNEQLFMVSCTFDTTAGVISTSKKISSGRIRYHTKVNNVGATVNNLITLELQDVRHDKLTANVAMDKWVTIFAKSKGTSGESGIRPVSCWARGNKTNSKYQILRAGCGDGLIIPKGTGFTSTGLEVRSPNFKSFMVQGDDSISYECTFVVCTQNCDGSSCRNARRPIK